MYKLYEFFPSGNCYKIRLLLTQLRIPFQRIEINIVEGGSRTSEFLKKNPNGRVPVLEIEEGKYLSESNAILYYLADETNFLSTDKAQRALTLQWLFFEQYNHEPNIATSRYWIKILKKEKEYAEALKKKKEEGNKALQVMEQHLVQNNFFVNSCYSIADIALFAYTHVAHEGGFDLNPFPNIRKWVERIKSQDDFIGITD
ncbi:MAG: glutathione S-transferase family protein [Deltaproteobacteria bacterium]|nr:glutathione S-transferase family protein [Deltaproteobacteria bacterium]